MCQYIPILTSHRAPMQSPLPHHLTSLSSRLDPRCMAVCIRMSPRRTLSRSPATCGALLFGLQVRLATVVIGYVFVFQR